GSVIGPVYGSIFFAVVNQSAVGSSDFAGAVFPAALLLALILLPDGIYGFAERAVAKISLQRSQPTDVRRKARLNESVAEVPRRPTEPTTEEILRVQSVSVGFGGVRALADVS